MAFKIKDSFRIGTKDVANSSGEILTPTIVGTATVIAAATQDGIALQGRAGGTSSYIATFTPTTLTANRTLTIPNNSGTIALTSDIVDTNTTYAISAETTTGGANLRLTAGGSGSGTDDVKFASGTNVTVTQTDVNTITISAASGTDVNLSVADDTTNNDRYIPFLASATGAQTGFTNADFRFNPSTDSLIIGSVAGAAPNISSSSTGTATVFNANVTTLNLGGAATTVGIATSATTTVTIGSATGNNTLSISGNGTGGTATITTNVTTGAVNLFTGVTGVITVGGANSTLSVAGNLTVNGTTTTVNSTTTTLDDPIFTLGGDTSVVEVTKDRGIEAKWNGTTLTITNYIGNGTTTVTGTVASTTGYAAGDIITISGATGTEQAKLNGTWTLASVPNGTTFTFVVTSSVAAGTLTTNLGTTVKSKNAFFGLDQSTGNFTFIPQANNVNEVFSGTTGTLDVASITGSAATLTTSRTLWGQSFNGSANVTGSLTSVGTNITASAGLTIASAAASNIALNSGTTGTVTVDSGSTGAISIGTNANAKTVTIGNTTGASKVVINSGTGGIILGTTTYGSESASGSLTLSSTSNATKGTVTVGDSNAGTLTLQGATVNLKVGAAASAGFLKVAATTGLVSIDTATYLTAESDTLQTVTGRGATSTNDIQMNNASLVLAPATTAKVWRRALAPSNITANTATSIDSWATATYRSAKYSIQITQGSKYQISELNMIHDGTTVYLTEFAVLETNAGSPIPATYSAAIATGTMTLSVTITDAATTNAAIIIERVLYAV